MESGTISKPAKQTSTAPVDFLNRNEVLERIMKILEVISERGSSCTFSLNGAWGTGKTFVLNMLANRLWEYHSDKYIVFRYNCWQYDYYDEPLIAIVAAMLDSVDEETHLLPANLRDRAKAGMELAKPVIRKIAADFVRLKTGMDLAKVTEPVANYLNILGKIKQQRADSRSFDEFYSFNKTIRQAHDEMRKLTKDRMLVIVVDELDRCLPSYAIKVLERLHHLFDGLNNSAVILAVDKSQLDQTIAMIFGSKVETKKYLRKFINFEIELYKGHMSSGFWAKYSDYFSRFDDSLIDTDFPYEEFISALFSGVDMRTQERIMDRVLTTHCALFANEPKDYSFMCCELLCAVFREIYHLQGEFPFIYKSIRDEKGEPGFKLRIPPSAEPYTGTMIPFIETYWSHPYISVQEEFRGNRYVDYMSGPGTIQKLLILYMDRIPLGNRQGNLFTMDFSTIPNIPFERNISELRSFIILLSQI